MNEDHGSYIRNFCSCEKEAWKKFWLVRDSNPWSLRCRCSALPIKLTSQLREPVKGCWCTFEYMKIIYVNCGVKNYMNEDHRSHIYTQLLQLRKESLKNFSLVRDSTLDLCEPLFMHIILHSAVHIYDFHIFITSSSSFHGYITNQFNADLLPVGLLAYLIELCTGIAEVRDSKDSRGRWILSSFSCGWHEQKNPPYTQRTFHNLSL